MYGLGGGGTTGVTATAAGATGVAVLPNTGGFRVMFIVAAVAMAVGIVTLVATGVIKLKRSLAASKTK
jgi:hypothetical protein